MSGMKKITGEELEGMVEHWLGAPVNGYLGSSYGQDINAILQSPHSDKAPDELIKKLREDIIITTKLPPEAVSVYGVNSGADRLDIILDVNGRELEIWSNRQRA